MHELEDTVRRLGYISRVTRCDASISPLIDTANVELIVPQTDATILRLTCEPPTSPDQAVALGSVLQVGKCALELERLREAERQRAALWPEVSAEASAGVIFESDAMREVLTIARRIADTSVPVLITGETGTGKEVLARLIHTYSGRSKAVFVPFNCTSSSRDMIESQLFGHRKGAFTGATEHSHGIVRAANHGTLMLDEIGDMHAEVQPKLLRFLESGEIHPIGEPKPIPVNVRVIAATNIDLKDRVSHGAFREDLYYRLNVVPLRLPPLRERRSEIGALSTHYLAKHSREFAKSDLRLSDEALEFLLLFRWPGNIRQLANEMRRVAALADNGTVVTAEHLSGEITGFAPPRIVAPQQMPDNQIAVRVDQSLASAVELLERAMIVSALDRANGAVERAAQMLGLSRKGLYLKRHRYNIRSAMDASDLEIA